MGGRTVVPGGWHIVFSFEPWDWGMRMEWNSGIGGVWEVWRVEEVRDSGIGIDYAR